MGDPAPRQELPGHDLTYQVAGGVARPAAPAPDVPRRPGRRRARRLDRPRPAAGARRGQGARYAEVSLAEAADDFAAPWRHGLTTCRRRPGGLPRLRPLPCARTGWVALAALEAHFWDGLVRELGLTAPDRGQLQQAFLTRTAEEWEAWAEERGLPLVRVRER